MSPILKARSLMGKLLIIGRDDMLIPGSLDDIRHHSYSYPTMYGTVRQSSLTFAQGYVMLARSGGQGGGRPLAGRGVSPPRLFLSGVAWGALHSPGTSSAQFKSRWGETVAYYHLTGRLGTRTRNGQVRSCVRVRCRVARPTRPIRTQSAPVPSTIYARP